MRKAKSQFIDDNRGRWSVPAMCQVLKVTRQGYCQWASRPISAHDERDFESDGPNKAWFADITYVKTYQGWLYVAVVIDIWSRMVVGWAMGPRIDAALADDALRMAIAKEKEEEVVENTAKAA